MNLHLDLLSQQRLEEALAGEPGIFKLFYDTEDCGCNGVLVIQIVSEPRSTDLVIQSEPFPFVCDRQQESLFDHTMRLEADPNYPAFKLISDSNIFSTNIRLRDIRL